MYTDHASSDAKLVFICVDESNHALRAFEWFYEHHYREEHTVGLVHVEPELDKHCESKQNGVDPGTKHYDVMKKSAAIIEKYMQKCAQYGMKAKIFSKVKIGSVGNTICELIQENDPSLIVIGQRGINAMQRTLFGSVSEYILHHAHAPILIVPPTKGTKK